MREVIRIDIMPEGSLSVSVPVSVPDVAEAAVMISNGTALSDASLFAESLLSLNLNGDALADAEMQEDLTCKSAVRRDSAGNIRTHTLQVGIEAGGAIVKAKERGLNNNDFHLVLTTVSGIRYLVHGLPNTCAFSTDEQKGSTDRMSIKVTVQSMSGFMEIQ